MRLTAASRWGSVSGVASSLTSQWLVKEAADAVATDQLMTSINVENRTALIIIRCSTTGWQTRRTRAVGETDNETANLPHKVSSLATYRYARLLKLD